MQYTWFTEVSQYVDIMIMDDLHSGIIPILCVFLVSELFHSASVGTGDPIV